MWLIYQLDPAGAAYHNVLLVRMEGNLDLAGLERSVNEIIRRHEPLRATFATADGAPAQLIGSSLRLAIPVVETGPPGRPGSLDAALRLAAQETQRPFDLAAGPPIRCVLLRLTARDHLLVVAIHHIASDGASMTIFLTELLALYTAFVRERPPLLDDLPVTYTQFISTQRDRLSGDRLSAGTGYWERQLAGSPALLELPADQLRPPTRSGRGAVYPVELSADLVGQLRELGRAGGATLFMIVLAAFQVLLYRHSGQRDILVGSPMTHRVRKEVRGMIGYLSNMIVLRSRITGDPTFRELLGAVRQTAVGAYAHADIPFEKVVQALRPRRALSHHPVFQVALSFHESLGGPLHQTRFEVPGSGIHISFPRLDAGTSRLDLSLCVHESAGALGIDFEYATDLFEEATVARLAACFTTLLTSIVRHPDERVSMLRMLPPRECPPTPTAERRPAAPTGSRRARSAACGPVRAPGTGPGQGRGRPADRQAHIDRAAGALGEPAPGGWDLPLVIDDGVVAGSTEDLLTILSLAQPTGSWPQMMICVGEPPLPGPWRRRLNRAAGLILVSLYGPPWTAIVMAGAGHTLPECRGRLIGSAIPGQRLEVLDTQRQLVPAGVPACLYAGSDGASVTATGDEARQQLDGRVELLGSLAAHRELGGVPIRPCLIEAALSEHPLVGEAAVTMSDGDGSASRLLAHVVPEPGAWPPADELRGFLRERLASYLVPAELVLVAQLPRTGRARIDRAGLARPGLPGQGSSAGLKTPGELALRALRRRRHER
jgi:hypothetical protein